MDRVRLDWRTLILESAVVEFYFNHRYLEYTLNVEVCSQTVYDQVICLTLVSWWKCYPARMDDGVAHLS